MLTTYQALASSATRWLGCCALIWVGAAAAQDADPSGRVARVNAIEGQASVQLAGDTSWTSDVINRPLTTGDKVWVDTASRAELHLGSVAARMGAQTGVELVNLNDELMQLRLSAGSMNVRVRNLERGESVEVSTPNVSVALLQPGEYRFDVNDNGDLTTMSVIRGRAEITASNDSWNVSSGERGEFRGNRAVSADLSDVAGPDSLDLWAGQRDAREDRSRAARYVSRDIPGYADLDDYGSWEDDSDYGPLWAPRVAVGWAPYHSGHWVWVSPWGWTWVDEAPWGFAPFHYGRWVHHRERWCWSPGRRGYRPVYAPALVGWVGGSHFTVGVSVGGGGVGWFPLGYNEVYRPGYRVSDHYIRNVNVTNTYITNTTIINNTTIVNGRRERDERGDRGRHYVNQRVPGAVAAIPRDAFVSARPVRGHMLRVDQRAVAAASGESAIAIAPTERSQARVERGSGRNQRVVMPAAAVFERPMVTRRVPPPQAPSFAAQRQAVVENGSRPVPMQEISRSRSFPMAPVRMVRPVETSRPIEAARSSSDRQGSVDRPDGAVRGESRRQGEFPRPADGANRADDGRAAAADRPGMNRREPPEGAPEPRRESQPEPSPLRTDRPPSAVGAEQVRPFDRHAHPEPRSVERAVPQDRAVPQERAVSVDRPAADDDRGRQREMMQRRDEQIRGEQQRETPMRVEQSRREQQPQQQQAEERRAQPPRMEPPRFEQRREAPPPRMEQPRMESPRMEAPRPVPQAQPAPPPPAQPQPRERIERHERGEPRQR